MADAGVTQVEIGRRLGVSQAMVSKYLAREEQVPDEEVRWIVDTMAEALATGASSEDGTSGEGKNPWCAALEGVDSTEPDARSAVFGAVIGILRRLQERVPAALVPAVSINIAGALPGASGRDDVLAFPGRLALVDGRLRAHGPPEFGTSTHLAAFLMAAQHVDERLRFVVNVRDEPRFLAAARDAGVHVVVADPGSRDDAGVAAFKVPGETTRPIVVRDPGGLGIEPAIYVMGDDAVVLADRLAALAEACRDS